MPLIFPPKIPESMTVPGQKKSYKHHVKKLLLDKASAVVCPTKWKEKFLQNKGPMSQKKQHPTHEKKRKKIKAPMLQSPYVNKLFSFSQAFHCLWAKGQGKIPVRSSSFAYIARWNDKKKRKKKDPSPLTLILTL